MDGLENLDTFLAQYNASRSHGSDFGAALAGPAPFSYMPRAAQGAAYHIAFPNLARGLDYGDVGRQQPQQRKPKQPPEPNHSYSTPAVWPSADLDAMYTTAAPEGDVTPTVTTPSPSIVSGMTNRSARAGSARGRRSVFSNDSSAGSSHSSDTPPRAAPGLTFAQFAAAAPSLFSASVSGDSLPSRGLSSLSALSSALDDEGLGSYDQYDGAATSPAAPPMYSPSQAPLHHRPAAVRMESISEEGESAGSSYFFQSDADHSLGASKLAYLAAAAGPSQAPQPWLWCEYYKILGCAAAFHPLDLHGWTRHHAAHMQWQYPRRLQCWFCMESFGSRGGGDDDGEAMLDRRMLHLHSHIVGPDHCDAAAAGVDGHALDHMLHLRRITEGAWRRAMHGGLPKRLHLPTGLVRDLPDDRRRVFEAELAAAGAEVGYSRGEVGESGGAPRTPEASSSWSDRSWSDRRVAVPYDLPREKRRQHHRG